MRLLRKWKVDVLRQCYGYIDDSLSMGFFNVVISLCVHTSQCKYTRTNKNLSLNLYTCLFHIYRFPQIVITNGNFDFDLIRPAVEITPFCFYLFQPLNLVYYDSDLV